jgi:thioredoxin 1
MAVVHITKDNFESIVASNPIVLIDFWAAWCGPCRSYGPIFEQVSDKHPDIVFGKIDTEAEQELAAMFGIQSIPSTVFYREQVPLHLQPGMLRPTDLESLIKQVRELDMSEVRADMAARQASAES